jgi:hypothetical protein
MTRKKELHFLRRDVEMIMQNINDWTLKAPAFYNLLQQLDHGSEIIIFKSILTTFIASIVSRGDWGRSKNWLKLKTRPP